MDDQLRRDLIKDLLDLVRKTRLGKAGPSPLDFIPQCHTLLQVTPAVLLVDAPENDDRAPAGAMGKLLKAVAGRAASPARDKVKAFGDLLGYTGRTYEEDREIFDHFRSSDKPQNFLMNNLKVRRVLAAYRLGYLSTESVKTTQSMLAEAFVDELHDYLVDKDGKLTALAYDLGCLPHKASDRDAIEEPSSFATASLPVDATRVADSIVHPAIARIAALVHRKLRAEERWRENTDPFHLSVQWDVASDEYFAPWSTVHGDWSRHDPLTLDKYTDITSAYLAIPSGRLVILGQGGSGKSTLAAELSLSLIDGAQFAHHRILPLVVKLDRWDPYAESLPDWIYNQALQEYNGLAKVVDKPTFCDVLNDDHIVAVLDGFDEVSPQARTEALLQINRTLGRLVLLSRKAEYHAATLSSNQSVSRAPAIILRDLQPGCLSDYLPRTALSNARQETNRQKWKPVLSVLEGVSPDKHAVGRLQRALSTPLMASLARTVYSDTDGNPQDLLDTEAFPDATALMRHFVSRFVEVRYDLSFSHLFPRLRCAARARKAGHWLAYLAAHSLANTTRRIEWWMYRRWSTPLHTVFVRALISLVLMTLWMAPLFGFPSWLIIQVPEPLAPALAVTLIAVATSQVTGLPTRPRLAGELARAVRAAVLFGVMYSAVLAYLLVLDFLFWRSAGSVTADVQPYFGIGLLFIAYVIAVASFTEDAVWSSPEAMLKADAGGSVLRGLWLGALYVLYVSIFWGGYSLVQWTIATVSVLIASQVLVFSHSASNGWMLTCLKLRAPLGLMKFLAEAQQCGLLRRVGPSYEFRHGMLQDYLAMSYFEGRAGSSRTLAGLKLRTELGLIFSRILSEGEGFSAEDDLRKLLLMQRKVADRLNYPDTLQALAGYLMKSGRVSDAINEARVALDYELASYASCNDGWRKLRRFVTGAPPPFSVAPVWQTLVGVLKEGGRHEEALSEQRAQVAFLRRSLHARLIGDLATAKRELTSLENCGSSAAADQRVRSMPK